MTSHRRKTLGALAAFAVLAASAAPGAGAAHLTPGQRAALEDSGRVDREVIAALAEEGRARVLLTFEVVHPVAGKGLRSFNTQRKRALLSEAADAVLGALPAGAFELRHRYSVVPALAGIVDSEGAAALLAAPGVKAIGHDLPGGTHLAESVPYIGAPDVWDMGFDGSGIVAAVIDSGVDYKHAALKAAVKNERKKSQCFCQTGGDCCPNGKSRQSGKKAAQDDDSHGTHVSAILAGRNKGGVWNGAAPAADILAIKVLDSSGSFCCYSDVLAALDWIATDAPQVDVVNMSLGTNLRLKGNCDNRHPAAEATSFVVKPLIDRGTGVFASSGNDNDRKKMGLPACAKRVASVGAQYDADRGTTSFSDCTDQGPIDAGDVVCFSNTNNKTSFLAPGAVVTSARLGGGTVGFVGTSMASPLAAGCYALLRQAFPEASTNQILKALEKGEKIKDPKNNKKIPQVECANALAELGG